MLGYKLIIRGGMNMKILCVCGTGQGSSLILKMSVQDILNRKGLQAELEHTDPSCACSDRCDFIMTSQEIADSITNPRAKIVCITNYINKGIIEKEIAEVLQALENEQK